MSRRWCWLVAACAALVLLGSCSSGVSSASPTPSPSEASSPAGTPGTTVATDAGCEAAASDLCSGRLQLATRIGATCHPDLAEIAAQRRTAAEELVKAALAAPDRAVELSEAALALDDSNVTALALARAGQASGTPVFPPVTASPAAGKAPAPSPCSAAEEAAASGELSRAEALLKSVDAKVECVAVVTADIERRRAADEPSRFWSRLQDSMPTAVLAAALVLLGALLGRFSPMPWWSRRGWVRRALLGLTVLALARAGLWVVLPALRTPDWHGVFDDGLIAWLRRLNPDFGGATSRLDLLGAALAGLLVIWWLKASAPTTVTVSGPEHPEDFASLICAQVATVSDARPGSTIGIAGGNDLDVGVTATVDAVTQPALKVLVAIWKSLTTGLGDRVSVRVTGTGVDRVALVDYVSGRRVLGSTTVRRDASVVDRAKPTDQETRDGDLDLATGVAAFVVLTALSVERGQRWLWARKRLYGTTSAKALANIAIGWRRGGAAPEARVALFARAWGDDPGSVAAAYSFAVAQGLGAGSTPNLASAVTRDWPSLLETIGTSRYSRTPLGWRAQYNLVALSVNALVRERSTGQPLSVPDDLRSRLTALEEQLRPRTAALGPPWHLKDRALATELLQLSRTLRHGLAAWKDPKQLAWLARLANGSFAADVLTPRSSGARSTYPATVPPEMNPRLGLNVAGGLILASLPGSPPDTRHAAITAALQLAGADPKDRDGVLDDDVIRTQGDRAWYRTLQHQWGRDEPADYAAVVLIGTAAASLLRPEYPDTKSLQEAVRDDADTVAARAAVPLAVVEEWWPGALAWLVAGQTADHVNLYQAAGITDAAAARRLGDREVLSRIGAVLGMHPTWTMPTAAQRDRMRQDGTDGGVAGET